MRCLKCFRTTVNCLCQSIKSFSSKTRFVLLMHPMEYKREKNGTGHLTHLSLTNSEIIVDIDFSKNERVMTLLNDQNYQCFVLYPGEKAINLHHKTLESRLISKKTPLIFVIDATWCHAKKMMRLSTNLHSLTRVSFDLVKKSAFYIKQQPQELCLSTIESVHMVLDLLDKQGLEKLDKSHHEMLRVFQEMIDFQIKCSLDDSLPSNRVKGKKGYSDPKDRKEAKRWNKYPLIFKD